MKNKKIIVVLAVVISLIASFSLGYNIKTKNNDINNTELKSETVEITTSKEKYSGKSQSIYSYL